MTSALGGYGERICKRTIVHVQSARAKAHKHLAGSKFSGRCRFSSLVQGADDRDDLGGLRFAENARDSHVIEISEGALVERSRIDRAVLTEAVDDQINEFCLIGR